MKKHTDNKNLQSCETLHELFGMLDCSLARYLWNARPWCRRPYLLLGAVARRLALEHEHYAGEIARLLYARKENVSGHTFPMEFTYFNDLSLEYLAPRLLDHQYRLITSTEAAVADLNGDFEARRVLEKLLASLRKYGSLLAELQAPYRLAPRREEHRPNKAALTRARAMHVAPAESQTAA
jgi:hypothetical protein